MGFVLFLESGRSEYIFLAGTQAGISFYLIPKLFTVSETRLELRTHVGKHLTPSILY